MSFAGDLFDRLRTATADLPGVTRASYGAGEAAAHAILAEAARGLGLEVAHDAIGTLRMRWPGTRPDLPAVAIGSHLDSVPHGGNFDGAAGVIMGLAAAAALVTGPRPERDLLVLGIRAEEMCWFPAHYLGSRALFGLLPRDAPDTIRRADTGRTLADHMVEQGFDPAPIRDGTRLLDPASLACFIEPHIEQGPVLVNAGLPAGLVTGIRGSLRYPRAAAHGQEAHAGAVPRAARRDAAMATARLLAALDARWADLEQEGADLVCTAGILATDPAHHAPTRIPGLVRFSLDIRSEDAALLAELDRWLADTADRITQATGVTFAFGPATHAAPALMDSGLQQAMADAARRANVATQPIASGGGHDCATFAGLGVKSAMLFIRNDHGSHNPHEAMDMADFDAALTILLATLPSLLAA